MKNKLKIPETNRRHTSPSMYPCTQLYSFQRVLKLAYKNKHMSSKISDEVSAWFLLDGFATGLARRNVRTR